MNPDQTMSATGRALLSSPIRCCCSRILGLSTAALAVALLAVGCASAPPVGPRPDFEHQSVRRIAVVPFYALSSFSLTQAQLDDVLHAGEAAAVEALRGDGFEVVGPRAFRHILTESGAAGVFDDGVLLRAALSTYFEPGHTKGPPSLEVATITALYDKGQLPADALLFGEVVYHTATHCRADPTEFNAHAELVSTTSTAAADSTEPGPCVVSHFQAKLIDAPTGETMWFNRILVQTRVKETDLQVGRQNVHRTVERTLDGANGLAGFRAPADPAPTDQPTNQAQNTP